MNVVIPLTRPHALPRQHYDEVAVAAGDRRGLFQNPSLRALCSGQEGEQTKPTPWRPSGIPRERHGPGPWLVGAACAGQDASTGGSLMIEARAWQPRAAVVSRSTTGSEVGAARWWTEASMHRAGRRGFRRGPVTADLERGVWTLAADGPTFGARPARPVGRPAAASASARANAAAAPGASTADATRAERGHDVRKGSGSAPGWRRSAGTTP